MALPPSEAGGLKLTAALELPGAAHTFVGSTGTVFCVTAVVANTMQINHTQIETDSKVLPFMEDSFPTLSLPFSATFRDCRR
jgi:hypothetical protein